MSMGLWILDGLDELGDDMRRRRAVGIAHAKIDDVAPRGARLGFQCIDLAENVGRQALDAIELFGHGGSAAEGDGPVLIPGPLFCEPYLPRRPYIAAWHSCAMRHGTA